MNTRGASKKGMTLIEVMVVLIVLVIVAFATVGTLRGFITRAEQNSRDQNARTLFLAAQTALLHLYANDPERAGEIAVNSAHALIFDQIAPKPSSDEWERETQTNINNLAFLESNAGQGAALIGLIGPYVDDKPVLAHNIVIEYNKVTGNVLACFYSEFTELSHGEGGYNVYNRSGGALRSAEVGFYGVDYTGARAARQPVLEESDELSVWLVDYDGSGVLGNNINGGSNEGLLTLEIALPRRAPADTIYSVRLTSSNNGNSWACAFSLSDQHNAAIDLTDARYTQLNSLDEALHDPISFNVHQAPGKPDKGNAVIYYDPLRPLADGRQLVTFVLDSQVEGAGIADLYADIASGFLVATVSAESASQSLDYGTAISDLAHALYADAVETNGTLVYEVSSVRHLNNVRSAMNGRFAQTRDIEMLDYCGDAYAMPPLGEGKNKNHHTSFTGVYDGNGHTITGLTMPAGVDSAGLFHAIGSGGTVEHVALQNGSINGSSLAGGIAASNDGTIRWCGVYDDGQVADSFAITVGGGSGVAGGITAVNDGSIEACYVGVGVKAPDVAGGIAGVSSGSISYCEVATAFDNRSLLTGTPRFGARAGGTLSAEQRYGERNADYAMDNNRRIVLATANVATSNRDLAELALAGGIAGELAGGIISDCINAARVGSNHNAAGGIVGVMHGGAQLTRSYNAGQIDAPGYAGGLAGQLYQGEIEACYNTGPVNCYLSATGLKNHCFIPLLDEQQRTRNGRDAGGLVGRLGQAQQEARVENCYSAGYVWSGDNTPYAGAFGRAANTSGTLITNCYILRNALNHSEAVVRGFANSDQPSVFYDAEAEKVVRVWLPEQMERLSISQSLTAVEVDPPTNQKLTFGPAFRINKALRKGTQNGGTVTYNLTDDYRYPALYDAEHGLGWDFHRTPYYPVLPGYAQVELSVGSANVTIICYVLDAPATLCLRLATASNGTYLFTFDTPITVGMSDSGSLTARSGSAVLADLDGDGVALDAGDMLYAYGYTRRYVITIPREELWNVTGDSGNDHDITAELYDGADNSILWAEERKKIDWGN